MAYSRYDRSTRLKGGKLLGTSDTSLRLRRATTTGFLSTRTPVSKENERLDILAGKFLGSAQYWWIIAACSGVGWALQVPPGKRLKIPTDISQVENLIG